MSSPVPVDIADPALRALRRLADDAVGQVRGVEVRNELRDIRARLGEPLRLAVMGAVSAGKSTLVNALLRMPVAATGATETTTVVAWLMYGPDHGRVVVDSIEGEHETRLLPGGLLPPDLGVPVGEIDRIRIYLDVPILRRLTVIDTPGGNTTTGRLQERADQALRDDAEAVLYLSAEVSTADRDTLAEFRELCRVGEFSATNALLVLTKVDNSQQPDPWPDAWARAARRLEQVRGLAFDVVPVAAAVAMTGGARLLRDEHLELLRWLASRAPDDLAFALDELLDPDPLDVPGPLAVRVELSERLRPYGLHVAIEHLRANPGAGLGDVHDELRRRSGVDPGPDKESAPGRIGSVADAVDLFARRADQLKALRAIHRLHELPRIPYLADADRTAVLRLLRALDDDPHVQSQLRDLRVTLALDAAGRGRLPLPPERLTELLVLAAGRRASERVGLAPDAAAREVRERSLTLARSWRAMATTAAGSTAGRHLHHVLDVYEELARPAVGELPGIPADLGPDPVARAATVAVLTDADREAVAALHLARCLGEQVGLDEAADGAAIADHATRLIVRFRTLSQRPMPLADKRWLLACTDAFEAIWFAANDATGR